MALLRTPRHSPASHEAISDLEPLGAGQHRRVGLVHNPTASRGRTGSAVELVRLTLIRLGYDVLSVEGDSYDSTRRAATGLLDDELGLDALIVVGGDGMVHLGLDVVACTGVPLGVVPTGTGNDIARHVGITGRDVPAAVAVIHRALSGSAGAHVAELDAMHVTRPDGSPVPDEFEWCMAVVCMGIDAAVNARANTLSWPAGEGRYVRALPAELADLTPYGYRVTTDSGTWEGGALLLSVANTAYMGGGMPISPYADAADGLLDVIRLDPVGRSGLLRHFSWLREGTHLGHASTHYERTASVTIEPLGERASTGLRHPPHPMADGEPIVDFPIRLTAVRSAMRLLVPDGPLRDGLVQVAVGDAVADGEDDGVSA